MKLNKYVVALTCTLAAAAHAESNFYVLGSAGFSLLHLDTNQADAILKAPYKSNGGVGDGLLSSTKLKDKHDVGYKLQLGYRVTKNFAIEGGYVDLGKAEESSDTTSTFTTTSPGPNGTTLYHPTILGTSKVKTDWKAKGWNIDAVAIVPVNDSFSVFAKFGLIQAKVKTSSDTSGYLSGSNSSSATHLAPIFGLGTIYTLNNNLSIRAEAESYSNVGNSEKTGQADVFLLSAGVAYAF